MDCQTRMSLLVAPITSIYAVLFVLGSILTITGNALSLIVLSTLRRRTRYNKLLICLSFADFLVGLIVFPLHSYQTVNITALKNCTLDFVRKYFTVFLLGTSVLVLAVLTFDRYILITKYSHYKKKSVKYIVIISVFLAWVFPALVPSLEWINSDVYHTFILLMFVGPFFILAICYVLITRIVRKQEKLITDQYLTSIQDPSIANDIEETTESKPSAPSETAAETLMETNGKLKILKSKKKQLNLTKSVIFLIFVYFCCILPLLVWLFFDMTKTMEESTKQNLYIFAMMTVSYNSFLNPLIYFLKNPEFRKGLLKMFQTTIFLKRSNDTMSSVMSS